MAVVAQPLRQRILERIGPALPLRHRIVEPVQADQRLAGTGQAGLGVQRHLDEAGAVVEGADLDLVRLSVEPCPAK
jgi:hypothetical protein